MLRLSQDNEECLQSYKEELMCENADDRDYKNHLRETKSLLSNPVTFSLSYLLDVRVFTCSSIITSAVTRTNNQC